MTRVASFLQFDRLPGRIRLAVPFVLLIIAGGFGWDYAYGDASVLGIVVYCLCLGCATIILLSLCEDIDEMHNGKLDLDAAAHDPRPDHIAENLDKPRCEEDNSASMVEMGASAPAIREPIKRQAQKPTQQAFDFDGLAALREVDELNGSWLRMKATDEAVLAVKEACLSDVGEKDPEHERISRWFEIVLGLKDPECSALPKAELRRAHVANSQGISKEQVRQIDQGRYAPLNKLLAMISPDAL